MYGKDRVVLICGKKLAYTRDLRSINKSTNVDSMASSTL